MISRFTGVYDLVFNIFCTKEDVKDFVFKETSDLFPGGKYGLLVNKFRKNITSSFVQFVVKNKVMIYNEKIFS